MRGGIIISNIKWVFFMRRIWKKTIQIVNWQLFILALLSIAMCIVCTRLYVWVLFSTWLNYR